MSCDPNGTAGNCTVFLVAHLNTKTIDTRIPLQFRMPIDRLVPMSLAVPCRYSNECQHIERLSRHWRQREDSRIPGCSYTPDSLSNTNSQSNPFPGHRLIAQIVRLFDDPNRWAHISCCCNRTRPNGKWIVFHSNTPTSRPLWCWCISVHCLGREWFCLARARRTTAEDKRFHCEAIQRRMCDWKLDKTGPFVLLYLQFDHVVHAGCSLSNCTWIVGTGIVLQLANCFLCWCQWIDNETESGRLTVWFFATPSLTFVQWQIFDGVICCAGKIEIGQLFESRSSVRGCGNRA